MVLLNMKDQQAKVRQTQIQVQKVKVMNLLLKERVTQMTGLLRASTLLTLSWYTLSSLVRTQKVPEEAKERLQNSPSNSHILLKMKLIYKEI